MRTYLLKRLLLMVPTLLGVLLVRILVIGLPKNTTLLLMLSQVANQVQTTAIQHMRMQ